MQGFSIWEMIKTIANLVLSTPIFLVSFVVGIILLIAMIVSMKKSKKFTKALMILIYVFLIAFVVIYYNSFLYNILDNFMNTIFTQLFFPNLATFSLVIFITLAILFYSLFSQKLSKALKGINMVISSLIIFLFILTLDKIVTLKINIYEPLTIYSDKTLLTLIEFIMITFSLWILLLLSVKIIKKLIKKSDAKVVKEFLDNNQNENSETLKL